MPEFDRNVDDQTVPTALLQELERLTGNACVGCGRPVCGHEALFSIVLGFKNAPRCLTCLASGLQSQPEELRDQLAEFMQLRDCYRQAWKTACEREASTHARQACCLGSSPKSAEKAAPRGSESAPKPEPRQPEACADFWNAGDMACGELVLALRGRLHTLPPGAILKVTARDPAASLDLPAWCRLTGNSLLYGQHPNYFIRRKEI
jgi:tRNA 2-thiouridine synthesizing protein A